MKKGVEKSEWKTKWIWEDGLVLKVRYDEEEDKTIAEYYEAVDKWFVIELIPLWKWCEIPWDCVEWFNFRGE